MATDDAENEFDVDLSEFMKNLRAKQDNYRPETPLLVYSPDPLGFLKRIPKTTVRPNPYAVNELLERYRDRELIDLYTERKQREEGETPKVDLEAIKALDNSELIDLYQEKKLRRHPV